MTVLSTSMSLRRLQMVAKLRRISLQHNCQNLVAGEAIQINSDSSINVKYDGTNIYLDSQGRLTLALPSTKLVGEYLSIIEDELPATKAINLDMALISDGARAASWHRVGEYYYTASHDDVTVTLPSGTVKSHEIESLFTRS